MDNQSKINQLLEKMDALLKRHDDFSKEIANLSSEIHKLKSEEEAVTSITGSVEVKKPSVEIEPVILKEEVKELDKITEVTIQPSPTAPIPQLTLPPVQTRPRTKSNIEKFIGENLINKVGILITILGVAIGAKYTIEHDLISPLTRIILGYLAGVILLGIGIKLKKKYENFSSVLVSGSIAIMYFITFAAYSFYDLIPKGMTFALMIAFTAFAVVAAINYSRQIIAHIGLVGAYAIPFLLSDGSGDIVFLLSYITIINFGMLILAFKKYWKALNYVSFVFTWLTYFIWYVSKYNMDEHFSIAISFLLIFFVIFYLTFLAYKLVKKEKFGVDAIVLLVFNSFIFYGLGYWLLSDHSMGKEFLGLFTLINAILHFVVSVIMYRMKAVDKNLFYLVSGLVLVFITMAVPVQFDGSWVTLLWVGEAALLFWIGRTKNISIYEKLSLPLMVLAFLSLGQDWILSYNIYMPEIPSTRITPIFNINLLTSLLFIGAFGFIHYTNTRNIGNELNAKKGITQVISYFVPLVLIFTIYYAFRLEIENVWDQIFIDSRIQLNTPGARLQNFSGNYDFRDFKSIWIINYTLFFVSGLALLNISKIKNKLLANVNLVLFVLTIGTFLIQGLYVISELRESYLDGANGMQASSFNITIRYVSLLFLAMALVVCYRLIKEKSLVRNFKMGFDLLLNISILWVASSELIHWMDIFDFQQSYKLVLSILFGVYSLILIVTGIFKNKKHLRIGAIILFGLTLIKLFLYDISHLNTIAKTIVFISLGVLLLIISFLYNKYKHKIFDEVEN